MSDALPLRRRATATGPGGPADPAPPDEPAAPDATVLARVADLLRADDATAPVEGERTAPQALT